MISIDLPAADGERLVISADPVPDLAGYHHVHVAVHRGTTPPQLLTLGRLYSAEAPVWVLLHQLIDQLTEMLRERARSA